MFHAMDQLALTKPITKWNGRAQTAGHVDGRLGAVDAAAQVDFGAAAVDVDADDIEVTSAGGGAEDERGARTTHRPHSTS